MEVLFTQILNYAHASHNFIHAMAQVQAAPRVMTYITAEHAVLFTVTCACVSVLRYVLRVVTMGLFTRLEHLVLTGVYALVLTIVIIMQI